ncbi:MAG: hypothetical protein J6P03_04510, partial [Opitutales bacterium]|nr:hypothetical protein [Opitutales bacterium]
ALAIEVFVLIYYMAFVYFSVYRARPPLEVCWLTETIYWGGVFIASIIYLKKADWKGKKI